MERTHNGPFRTLALVVLYRIVLVLRFLSICRGPGTTRSGSHGNQLWNLPLLATEKKKGVLFSAFGVDSGIPDSGLCL